MLLKDTQKLSKPTSEQQLELERASPILEALGWPRKSVVGSERARAVCLLFTPRTNQPKLPCRRKFHTEEKLLGMEFKLSRVKRNNRGKVEGS